MARRKAKQPVLEPEETTTVEDPMLDGYKFQISGKTPYDYITDVETGVRPGETKEPHGWVTVEMGFGDPKYKTVPPVAIWDQGHWYPELHEDVKKRIGIYNKDTQYNSWVTSGEGTPGNYEYRVYRCPDDIAANPDAPHPQDWPEGAVKKHATFGQNYGKTLPDTGYKSKSTADSGVPFNVAIRCIKCGHWYKMSDLQTHVTNCCPGVNGDNFDWAIRCECGPACSSLDATAAIKPGFPRALASPVTEEKKEDGGEPASS